MKKMDKQKPMVVLAIFAIAISLIFVVITLKGPGNQQQVNNNNTQPEIAQQKEIEKEVKLQSIKRDGYELFIPEDISVRTLPGDDISSITSSEAYLAFVSDESYNNQNKTNEVKEIFALIEIPYKDNHLLDQTEFKSLEEFMNFYIKSETNYVEESSNLNINNFIARETAEGKYIYGTITKDRYLLFINKNIEDPYRFKEILDRTVFEDNFAKPLISEEQAKQIMTAYPAIANEVEAKTYLKLEYVNKDLYESKYVFRLVENVENEGEPAHTATSNWYYLNMLTGEVASEF